jgi:hypothetical protein
MTTQEKTKLKTAKTTFKSVRKNYPLLHAQLRNDMIKQLVKSESPNWGGLNFKLTKSGV